MIALSLFLTFILNWSVQAEAASWLVTCETVLHFEVAIDASRKKTREKASILKRVKEPSARPTHTLA